MTARHLTIRDLPSDLARAVKAEARRRRASINQTVKDLLRQALGLSPGGTYENGLRALSGTWSREEHEAFERSVACFEEVDEELWR